MRSMTSVVLEKFGQSMTGTAESSRTNPFVQAGLVQPVQEAADSVKIRSTGS